MFFIIKYFDLCILSKAKIINKFESLKIWQELENIKCLKTDHIISLRLENDLTKDCKQQREKWRNNYILWDIHLGFYNADKYVI